jgi:hypothetical protein
MLGPALRASDLRDYLDRAQTAVLEASPDLWRFVTAPVKSPWLGEDAVHPWDRWWPRAR